VDVPDYHRRGETAPSPLFYQDEGEAEYVVSVYIYMRLPDILQTRSPS
jgi:intron-binding protein aquarius